METTKIDDNIRILQYQSSGKDITVIEISGELDMRQSYKCQNLLARLIETMTEDEELYLDLRKVVYMSSTGVGALSTALVYANKKHVAVYLSELHPKVRAIFDLLGLSSWFVEKNPDVPEF